MAAPDPTQAGKPNPYDDIGPWSEIGFGGTPIKPVLVEVGNVKVTDEWKSQMSRETSGKTWVFAGTTIEKPTITLEACDRADFDDLRRLWEQLKPVPVAGKAATPTPKDAPTKDVGSPTAEQVLQQAKDALQKLNSGTSGAASSSGGSSGGTFAIPGNTPAPAQNVGPKPPTVSVQNEILAFVGILAVARGEWEGPTPTETNSWRVKLTLVPQQPPKPAGAGAMAPAKAGGTPGGPVVPNSNGGVPFPINAITTNAAAGAAGT